MTSEGEGFAEVTTYGLWRRPEERRPSGHAHSKPYLTQLEQMGVLWSHLICSCSGAPSRSLARLSHVSLFSHFCPPLADQRSKAPPGIHRRRLLTLTLRRRHGVQANGRGLGSASDPRFAACPSGGDSCASGLCSITTWREKKRDFP